MILKNETYKITIIDNGENGTGIGKYEGFTIFVDGALWGDEVEVTITDVKKNYATGVLKKICKPSEFRINPDSTTKYQQCGGCQYQELKYEKQLELKTNQVKQAIRRIGGINDANVKDAIGMANPYHYRNKAQFPIAMNNGVPTIGYYQNKTHQVVAMESCAIQNEVNDVIIKAVLEYINTYQVSIYDPKTKKGMLKHLVTKTSYHLQQVMVILVINGDKLPHINELCDILNKNVPNLKSVIMSINKKNNHTVLGTRNLTIWGENKIVDTIGDLQFNISPLSFFQVNPQQTEVMYQKIAEFADVKPSDVVVDVYCGVGTISLFLAQKAKQVYGIEVIEPAIKDAQKNAKLNKISNVEFLTGPAETLLPELADKDNKIDIVVVDPPRSGCDTKVLDAIIKMNPKKMIYVSCNPATLARDLKYLSTNNFICEEIQPVDMFPHTAHIECVVKIKR